MSQDTTRPPPGKLNLRGDPRLAGLVDALNDEHRSVVRVHVNPCSGPIFVTVAARGVVGVQRFVDALRQVELDVGTDDEGVMMGVEPDWTCDDDEAALRSCFPDWAFLDWCLQEPDEGRTPGSRLLRDVVAALRCHRESLQTRERGPYALDEPGELDVDSHPRGVLKSGVHADLRPVLAALTEPGVVVAAATRRVEAVDLVVATHGARGLRRFTESLRRAYEMPGRREGVYFEAKLAWEASDRHRCDPERHPEWLAFKLSLLSYADAPDNERLRKDQLERVAKAVGARPPVRVVQTGVH